MCFFGFFPPFQKGVGGLKWIYVYKIKKYLPYNKELISRAVKMRNNPTHAEYKVWYFLRALPQRFLRQKPIGNYIVDFYCQKLNLVIEIDGETHLSDKDKIYDDERTKYLENLGLRVVRFWNDDILLGDFNMVAEEIEREIKSMGT